MRHPEELRKEVEPDVVKAEQSAAADALRAGHAATIQLQHIIGRLLDTLQERRAEGEFQTVERFLEEAIPEGKEKPGRIGKREVERSPVGRVMGAAPTEVQPPKRTPKDVRMVLEEHGLSVEEQIKAAIERALSEAVARGWSIVQRVFERGGYKAKQAELLREEMVAQQQEKPEELTDEERQELARRAELAVLWERARRRAYHEEFPPRDSEHTPGKPALLIHRIRRIAYELPKEMLLNRLRRMQSGRAILRATLLRDKKLRKGYESALEAYRRTLRSILFAWRSDTIFVLSQIELGLRGADTRKMFAIRSALRDMIAELRTTREISPSDFPKWLNRLEELANRLEAAEVPTEDLRVLIDLYRENVATIRGGMESLRSIGLGAITPERLREVAESIEQQKTQIERLMLRHRQLQSRAENAVHRLVRDLIEEAKQRYWANKDLDVLDEGLLSPDVIEHNRVAIYQMLRRGGAVQAVQGLPIEGRRRWMILVDMEHPMLRALARTNRRLRNPVVRKAVNLAGMVFSPGALQTMDASERRRLLATVPIDWATEVRKVYRRERGREVARKERVLTLSVGAAPTGEQVVRVPGVFLSSLGRIGRFAARAELVDEKLWATILQQWGTGVPIDLLPKKLQRKVRKGVLVLEGNEIEEFKRVFAQYMTKHYGENIDKFWQEFSRRYFRVVDPVADLEMHPLVPATPPVERRRDVEAGVLRAGVRAVIPVDIDRESVELVFDRQKWMSMNRLVRGTIEYAEKVEGRKLTSPEAIRRYVLQNPDWRRLTSEELKELSKELGADLAEHLHINRLENVSLGSIKEILEQAFGGKWASMSYNELRSHLARLRKLMRTKKAIPDSYQPLVELFDRLDIVWWERDSNELARLVRTLRDAVKEGRGEFDGILWATSVLDPKIVGKYGRISTIEAVPATGVTRRRTLPAAPVAISVLGLGAGDEEDVEEWLQAYFDLLEDREARVQVREAADYVKAIRAAGFTGTDVLKMATVFESMMDKDDPVGSTLNIRDTRRVDLAAQRVGEFVSEEYDGSMVEFLSDQNAGDLAAKIPRMLISSVPALRDNVLRRAAMRLHEKRAEIEEKLMDGTLSLDEARVLEEEILEAASERPSWRRAIARAYGRLLRLGVSLGNVRTEQAILEDPEVAAEAAERVLGYLEEHQVSEVQLRKLVASMKDVEEILRSRADAYVGQRTVHRVPNVPVSVVDLLEYLKEGRIEINQKELRRLGFRAYEDVLLNRYAEAQGDEARALRAAFITVSAMERLRVRTLRELEKKLEGRIKRLQKQADKLPEDADFLDAMLEFTRHGLRDAFVNVSVPVGIDSTIGFGTLQSRVRRAVNRAPERAAEQLIEVMQATGWAKPTSEERKKFAEVLRELAQGGRDLFEGLPPEIVETLLILRPKIMSIGMDPRARIEGEAVGRVLIAISQDTVSREVRQLIDSERRIEIRRLLEDAVDEFITETRVKSQILHVGDDEDITNSLLGGPALHRLIRSQYYHHKQAARQVLEDALTGWAGMMQWNVGPKMIETLEAQGTPEARRVAEFIKKHKLDWRIFRMDLARIVDGLSGDDSIVVSSRLWNILEKYREVAHLTEADRSMYVGGSEVVEGELGPFRAEREPSVDPFQLQDETHGIDADWLIFPMPKKQTRKRGVRGYELDIGYYTDLLTSDDRFRVLGAIYDQLVENYTKGRELPRTREEWADLVRRAAALRKRKKEEVDPFDVFGALWTGLGTSPWFVDPRGLASVWLSEPAARFDRTWHPRSDPYLRPFWDASVVMQEAIQATVRRMREAGEDIPDLTTLPPSEFIGVLERIRGWVESNYPNYDAWLKDVLPEQEVKRWRRHLAQQLYNVIIRVGNLPRAVGGDAVEGLLQNAREASKRFSSSLYERMVQQNLLRYLPGSQAQLVHSQLVEFSELYRRARISQTRWIKSAKRRLRELTRAQNALEKAALRMETKRAAEPVLTEREQQRIVFWVRRLVQTEHSRGLQHTTLQASYMNGARFVKRMLRKDHKRRLARWGMVWDVCDDLAWVHYTVTLTKAQQAVYEKVLELLPEDIRPQYEYGIYPAGNIRWVRIPVTTYRIKWVNGKRTQVFETGGPDPYASVVRQRKRLFGENPQGVLPGYRWMNVHIPPHPFCGCYFVPVIIGEDVETAEEANEKLIRLDVRRFESMLRKYGLPDLSEVESAGVLKEILRRAEETGLLDIVWALWGLELVQRILSIEGEATKEPARAGVGLSRLIELFADSLELWREYEPTVTDEPIGEFERLWHSIERQIEALELLRWLDEHGMKPVADKVVDDLERAHRLMPVRVEMPEIRRGEVQYAR